LHWAASSNKHSNVILTLIKHDPHLAEAKDQMGRYAIHLAAGEGNCAIVDALLKSKVTKIGFRDDLLRTPLHWCCVRGHVACTKLLCDRGANLNKVDQYGASPIHYAAEKNFADCVHVLVKMGAITDIKDENGETPIHWAASEGSTESVKLLLETDNVEIDCQDAQGLTPLHLSAYFGRTSTVVFLVQHGSDGILSGPFLFIVNALDSKDHSPLFRAVIGGSSDCTLALINERSDGIHRVLSNS
jgi:inversin